MCPIPELDELVKNQQKKNQPKGKEISLKYGKPNASRRHAYFKSKISASQKKDYRGGREYSSFPNSLSSSPSPYRRPVGKLKHEERNSPGRCSARIVKLRKPRNQVLDILFFRIKNGEFGSLSTLRLANLNKLCGVKYNGGPMTSIGRKRSTDDRYPSKMWSNSLEGLPDIEPKLALVRREGAADLHLFRSLMSHEDSARSLRLISSDDEAPNKNASARKSNHLEDSYSRFTNCRSISGPGGYSPSEDEMTKSSLGRDWQSSAANSRFQCPHYDAYFSEFRRENTNYDARGSSKRSPFHALTFDGEISSFHRGDCVGGNASFLPVDMRPTADEEAQDAFWNGVTNEYCALPLKKRKVKDVEKVSYKLSNLEWSEYIGEDEFFCRDFMARGGDALLVAY